MQDARASKFKTFKCITQDMITISNAPTSTDTLFPDTLYRQGILSVANGIRLVVPVRAFRPET